MDISSTEHFFDFLFSSGACQDFACGTTKIKFESGEEQRIPHDIITSKFRNTLLFIKGTVILFATNHFLTAACGIF